MRKISTAFAIVGILLMVALLVWSAFRVTCGVMEQKHGIPLREAIKR